MGLLVLRESLPYRIVSTPWVRDVVLGNNAAWRLMEPAWGIAKLDQEFALDRDEVLKARFFPVPGKVPGYLEGLASNHPEATVGLRIADERTGKRIVYAAGIKALDEATLAELSSADVRFVDGTFWTAQELLALRPGAPDAHAMGHLPIGGPDGSLVRLARLPGRSIYIHINNTNPILDANSPQSREVRDAGVEIAHDGMEIEV
jgi:pyrroloquinoline quinone biosynthesis protein B